MWLNTDSSRKINLPGIDKICSPKIEAAVSIVSLSQKNSDEFSIARKIGGENVYFFFSKTNFQRRSVRRRFLCSMKIYVCKFFQRFIVSNGIRIIASFFYALTFVSQSDSSAWILNTIQCPRILNWIPFRLRPFFSHIE